MLFLSDLPLFPLPSRGILCPAVHPSSDWDEEGPAWNRVTSGIGIHSRFLKVITSSLDDLNLVSCYIKLFVLTAVLFGFPVCV